MKTLQKVLPSKNKSNSLFFNLIIGFLTIIIVLVTLHFITISISANKVRDEIIKYNTLNLNNTVDSYEKHLEMAKRTMLSFLINDEVQNFNKQKQYIKFPVIQAEIQKIVSNPSLFIRDIILFSNSDAQILDKSKSTNADTMFNVFLINDVYTRLFWDEQFAEPYNYKILSATTFEDRTMPKAPSYTEELIPVVFKGYVLDQFYIIALLDAASMFRQFHVSINENLFIMDGDRLVYSNTDTSKLSELPTIANKDKKYTLANNHYYFYEQGDSTNFTYIHIIPQENIAAQTKMIATLLLILLAAIVISITAAILFIQKINNPLKKVIESLKDMNMNTPIKSNIKEFHVISDRFAELLEAKQHIHEKLDQEELNIRNYSYMKQVKDIGQSGGSNLSFSNQPFVLILFEFIFKDKDNSELTKETERKWYLYAKEFIDISISLVYEQSLTFQMEKNQVLSLVFLNSDNDLKTMLNKMKATFELDRTSGFATIAVSSTYYHSSELTKAYDETIQLIQLRSLSDETEIIVQQQARQTMAYSAFSADEERLFDVHLKEGNTALVIDKARKRLMELQQGGTASEVIGFAKLVTDKCIRALYGMQVVESEIQAYMDQINQINHCYTFEELELFLNPFLTGACERIKLQKQMKQTDSTTEFIIEYVENHFAQEIYLDSLADKLKMSSGYLSVYFKEKTGKNFIDYLNEVRISKAKVLLSETGLKVRDIAEKVGYQNINSFNRMFKKFTGITPGEYRKKHSYDV